MTPMDIPPPPSPAVVIRIDASISTRIYKAEANGFSVEDPNAEAAVGKLYRHLAAPAESTLPEIAAFSQPDGGFIARFVKEGEVYPVAKGLDSVFGSTSGIAIGRAVRLYGWKHRISTVATPDAFALLATQDPLIEPFRAFESPASGTRPPFMPAKD
jgi:hypothetical protein